MPDPSTMIIKAISLWQPWATAWTLGLKIAETRGWRPRQRNAETGQLETYSGPLAVHAAQTERDPATREPLSQFFCDRLQRSPGTAARFAEAGFNNWGALPRGAIVGICWLDAVKPTTSITKISNLELAWGNYDIGRYAWYPAMMTRIDPIPCRGRQSLFNWEVPPHLRDLTCLTPPPF